MAPLAAVPVLLLAGAGCAGHSSAQANARVLRVTERDFRISLPQKHVRAGEIEIHVRNKGPDRHELIIVRREGRLPMRPDGVTVDEEALEPVEAAALEPEEPGLHRLKVRLAPGRYELFCNMSGHFLGGMHAELVVS